MTEHEKALAIVNELGLSYVKIGKILDCSWQSVQKKRNLINNNKFTKKDLADLEKYLKQK